MNVPLQRLLLTAGDFKEQQSDHMKTNSYSYSFWGRTWNAQFGAILSAFTLLFGFGLQDVEAKPKVSNVTVVPTIENISIVDGQLVASGSVSGTVKGQDFTAPFENVPVDITLAQPEPGDTNAPAACGVLDLALGPINLDVLGLVVETSPICLEITAIPGGGLLGDLLCSVANLLNGGLSIGDILGGLNLVDPVTGVQVAPALTTDQINQLLGAIEDLLNGALGQLIDAILTEITDATGLTCGILHLELGPLDLNLLGLAVSLDDCDGGPVVVDITGERGAGNLLGNLLCGLLGGGGLNLGDTLQDILDGILGRLPGN
jgi:hypothetical protein